MISLTHITRKSNHKSQHTTHTLWTLVRAGRNNVSSDSISTMRSIVVQSSSAASSSTITTIITHNHTNAATAAVWHHQLTSHAMPIVSFLINSVKSIIPLCHHARYLCAAQRQPSSPLQPPPSSPLSPAPLSASSSVSCNACNKLPAHAFCANQCSSCIVIIDPTSSSPPPPFIQIALPQASAENRLYFNLTGHRLDDHRFYRRLLVQLEETERRFDEFWSTHLARLKLCLDLRRFEQDFRELQVSGGGEQVGWFHWANELNTICILIYLDSLWFAFKSGVRDDGNRRNCVTCRHIDLGNKDVPGGLQQRHRTRRRGGHYW